MIDAWTIAIVGAGFCGMMTAVHLLRHSSAELRLLLIDPHSNGQGVAYQLVSDSYLLNVPAGRMGAWPEQPEDFLQWLQHYPPALREGRQPQSGDYVPRSWYGQYLNALYQEQLGQVNPQRFQRLHSEVRAVRREDRVTRLILADGSEVLAETVVLALGNFPPAHPQLQSPEFLDSPRYFQNPWLRECLEGLHPEQDLLLLGSGLTMVDLVLGLKQKGFRGGIQVLSPHGYLPLPHQESGSWPDFLPDQPLTQRELLHCLRQQLTLARSQGVDWRAVIDALRPQVQTLWQSWSLTEKQRFMRHLRHLWGVHRHRTPVEVHARIQSWLEDGSLRVMAGRALDLQETPVGVWLTCQARGTNRVQALGPYQRVINCTGPCGNYEKLQHPLIADLRAQHLILPDALRLGLLTDGHGALLNARGEPSDWLYTLGSPLRAQLWESIAVPELRLQAQQLAQYLWQRIQQKPRLALSR